jgi:hypothetical protein
VRSACRLSDLGVQRVYAPPAGPTIDLDELPAPLTVTAPSRPIPLHQARLPTHSVALQPDTAASLLALLAARSGGQESMLLSLCPLRLMSALLRNTLPTVRASWTFSSLQHALNEEAAR